MIWLAHSGRLAQGIPAQSYQEHVGQTIARSTRYAERVKCHAPRLGVQLSAVVSAAAELHDLGKLIDDFQAVLRGERDRCLIADGARYNHADAGAAHLLRADNPFAALLVHSHHIGLPPFSREFERERDGLLFRSESPAQRALTERTLKMQMERHRFLFPAIPSTAFNPLPVGSVFYRLALSCLADADHGDTARHYGENEPDAPELRPTERLVVLDRFVSGLSKGRDDDRTRLRSAIYRACRDNLSDARLMACDSPVGTGKTTAIMAHLLSVAIRRKLDRIVVVLPYTNIIDEAVATYREALVLEGESPELVVAAHHHRADFQDPTARAFTALWRAPIVVTTAVQFYETLAAASPSGLRRLHALPGSAFFIDEAHASLPVHLLPLAWHWHQEFATDWGCHCVFASGSLTRYWRLPDIVGTPAEIPDLLEVRLQRDSHDREQRRINIRRREDTLDLGELCHWLSDEDALPGPRLLIVNTVQTAAVIAEELANRSGRQSVEHLSTALLPDDRKRTLERIRQRLRPSSPAPAVDVSRSSWTLVATTCVEAGVNLSFRTGLRERAGLVNLLQAAGRINREGELASADIWTFSLKMDSRLTRNRAFEDGAKVLETLFKQYGKVSPGLCPEALRLEIRDHKRKAFQNSPLMQSEETADFPEVARLFRVIDGDNVLVLVDQDMGECLDNGGRLSWLDLQRGCVSLYRNRVDNLRLQELTSYPGVYRWTLGYDGFIGVMRGILDVAAFDDMGGGCV